MNRDPYIGSGTKALPSVPTQPESDRSNSIASLPSLRLVVMGTGPFAVPTFESLIDSGHQILALVTRPDRPTYHREKSPINPMRAVAKSHSIDVFEPESVNSLEAHSWLQFQKADLFAVCDYGQILSQNTLGLARLGGINLHASLLPTYRGAAPINWAIFHGETETGVSVIHMTQQLDAGPVLIQRRIAIDPRETAPELESRLAILGMNAVLEAIKQLRHGVSSRAVLQDSRSATKAPRLKKEDGLIIWSRSATAIFNQVRAFQPWPKTYTFWKRPVGEPMRLILERVKVVEDRADIAANTTSSPGTVLLAQANDIIVACGEQLLRIEQLQPAGKRTMLAGEFLRGHPLPTGTLLG